MKYAVVIVLTIVLCGCGTDSGEETPLPSSLSLGGGLTNNWKIFNPSIEGILVGSAQKYNTVYYSYNNLSNKNIFGSIDGTVNEIITAPTISTILHYITPNGRFIMTSVGQGITYSDDGVSYFDVTGILYFGYLIMTGDSQFMIAYRGGDYSSNRDNLVFVSIDNGVTWIGHDVDGNDQSTESFMPTVPATSGNICIIADFKLGLWVTEDKGTNWNLIRSTEHFELVTTIGSNFIALGTKKIYTSTDGINWTEANLPSTINVVEWDSLKVDSKGDWYARATLLEGEAKGYILRSTDQGNNWTKVIETNDSLRGLLTYPRKLYVTNTIIFNNSGMYINKP